MTISTTTTLSDSAVPATFSRRDERGSFVEAITTGPWETVITGTMNAGAVIGNHYHKKTRMFFFVLTGLAIANIVNVETGERRTIDIDERHGLHLNPGEAHAISFETETTYVLLKSQTYDENDPDTFAYSVLDEPAK